LKHVDLTSRCLERFACIYEEIFLCLTEIWYQVVGPMLQFYVTFGYHLFHAFVNSLVLFSLSRSEHPLLPHSVTPPSICKRSLLFSTNDKSVPCTITQFFHPWTDFTDSTVYFLFIFHQFSVWFYVVDKSTICTGMFFLLLSMIVAMWPFAFK